ncbi:hypothetical protein PCANC_07505 [Puccinia coronata f. sp. avenae]|uniref:Uncharacterized protein n=1 Tax=Puccinia coronata f. sp. avenae TaxID=200324 RepID=A0A2N5VTD5_9BASI|nr:hypothetical protein PCANC_07505 [Puccinia coronata f. sp. avenae]
MEYIDWLQIDSDTESYSFDVISEKTESSVIWMSDSPPDLEFNHLDEGETVLPQYEFGIGGVICYTIIDSGAGTIYLDVAVAQGLYHCNEIKIEYANAQNIRLANGHVEQVKMKARFKLCIDGNKSVIEAFLINLPKMDLVLGLPWLCQTQAVPDYNDMSYTFLDQENKIVNARPFNNKLQPRNKLNSVCIEEKVVSMANKFAKVAYQTAPEAFREIVGLPRNKEFEHDINTGDAAPAKVHGQPYSPPEHLLIDQFVKEALEDGIIRPRFLPFTPD